MSDLRDRIFEILCDTLDAHHGSVEGIKEAVAQIMSAVEEDRQDDYRSTVLDITARD